jgi:NNP family nitrate/nitrite transporter-like MFS transporter
MFRSHLPALLLFTLIFFVNFLARIVLAPLLPSVEADLSLSHVESGSLFLLISIGYFFTLLCSGFISSRLTHKQTIIFSSTMLGLALVYISFSTSLLGIRMGLIALGMATGPYLPSGIASLTDMVESHNWGKAIAIHELAPNLSFVLAPLISELVLIWFSWRTVFVTLGLTALLLGGIFARYGRGGSFKGNPIRPAAFKSFITKPVFWIMVVLFCLGISNNMGIYTMLPIFLVSTHGIQRSWANTLLSLSRVAAVGMALAGGWATDYFGPRSVLKIVFLVSGLLTIFIGLAPSSWVAVAVFLQPLAAVCFFPAGLAALSATSSSEGRNLAVALAIPITILFGGGFVPTFIGLTGDFGSFALGIVLTGTAISIGFWLCRFVRN